MDFERMTGTRRIKVKFSIDYGHHSGNIAGYSTKQV